MPQSQNIQLPSEPLDALPPAPGGSEECWMCGAPVHPGEELHRGGVCKGCENDLYDDRD